MLMTYSLKDFIQFTNKNLNSISDDEFNSIYYRFSNKDNRYFKPMINYSSLAHSKLIKSNNNLTKKLLNSIIDYIHVQTRSLIYS